MYIALGANNKKKKCVKLYKSIILFWKKKIYILRRGIFKIVIDFGFISVTQKFCTVK